MKIGIDARGLGETKTGIATYIEEIIKQLNNINDRKNEYILYSNRPINIDAKLKDNITVKNYNKPFGTFWIYFSLPKILKNDKIDVFWGTQHCLPKRNRCTKNIKFVLTVHDLAIHKLKHVGEWKNTIIQKMVLKKSCRKADIIISVSESTKRDLVDMFRINNEKIKVIYSGTNFENNYNIQKDNEKDILKKFKVQDRNYLMFVSTIEPRKNIITLVKAFEYLKKKDEYKELKLILAGGLGWNYKEILDTIKSSEYANDINLPGYISKEEKQCLLHNTKCFVYPSLYEGFGLPILEAMANEALVVTSNISSIPEVGGDAAFYFNNVNDYEELAEVIKNVLNLLKDEKEKKIKLGLEQTRKFSWEKCANETLEILSK